MLKQTLMTLLFAQAASLAQANESSYDYAVSSIRSAEFKLDSGGEAKTHWIMGHFGIKHRLDAQNSVGIDFSAARQDWDFKHPQAWGGKTPWETIEQTGVSLNYTFASPGGLIYSFSPSVEYSGETDAEHSDGLNYGATGFIAKSFSPDLLLGLGLGAFSNFDDTSVFPFIIVNWQITPTLRLSNPFTASAVGPAGLELSWAATPQFDLATGGTMRSYRSRLAKNNSVASSGVLEQKSFPLFVRAGYRFNSALRLDGYLGSAMAGEMLIHDQNGNEVVKEKHDPIPFIAVTFSGQF
ncbi:DUF6268 family outer membrane beta-barrel protein [Chitinibacter sp. SCUT-21]|uniref:DUF6268 family outer membrane beta-barrel protein n=1 Tax=Chitinibacter sp. SCUT-21 TaxID=2970891 RepID=UPI0035A67CBF